MRAIKFLAATGLAAVLLAGCTTLEPVYRRPALPTPNAFPQAPPAVAPHSVASSAAAIGWRDVFLDPKLRSVIELALANNRDLRVALANIEAARAQYGVQRADLIPQLNGSAGAAYGRVSEAPGVTIDEHQYSVTLATSAYEVDLFGRVRSLTKAALQQYLATEEARRASQIAIVAETATDDLTLASDEAILKTAQDTLASSRASLDIAQKRLVAGVASQLDVSQAQTQVQQARADVANDTTMVAQARDALDLVVGSPVPDALLPDVQGDRLTLLADLPAGLPSDVLLARPDVVEAEHTLIAANAKIGAARAAFFPTITLTASGGVTSPSLSSLFTGASRDWSFTPQVTLPIFEGGVNLANLRYAKAERTVAVAQYEKAIQTAFSEVADALARRATIDEQISADEGVVAAAQDALTLSQARYERGADTYLNVLIAQRTLYTAQQALVSGRLVRATNLVALYQALGGGGL